jgi:hypothetical protein
MAIPARDRLVVLNIDTKQAEARENPIISRAKRRAAKPIVRGPCGRSRNRRRRQRQRPEARV